MLSRLTFLAIVIPIAAVQTLAADQLHYFQKLLVADSEAKVSALPADKGGSSIVYVQDVAVLTAPDFAKTISRFKGRPITNELLNELAKSIYDYAQVHDRLVRFSIPTQDISGGVVRFVVLVGHYNELTIKGNKWFSTEFLQERLGIKPGDEVRFSALNAAVNWANTNPFRHIQVLVQDLPMAPGKADLLVGVEDQRPMRFALSYDNGGVSLLGDERYTASVQLGNLWSLDHQASYQFTTTNRGIDNFQLHTFNYRIPLHWRHYIDMTTTYLQVRPNFSGTDFNQLGQNIVTDLRYSIPTGGGDHATEYFAAIDFKESNNNLEFGGTTVSKAKVDTFQLELGFSALRRNTNGAWLFGATTFVSPGNINSRNSDEQFQPSRTFENFHVGRPGASARYISQTVSLQRLQPLGKSWDIFSRFSGQVTSTNLISNEQLVIGGSNTVRGFEENIMAGDQGFVLNTDLEAPSIERKVVIRKNPTILGARCVAFYDFGEVWVKHTSAFDPANKPLASAGLGLRMSIPNYFSLNLDYGWQITRLPTPVGRHARGHIKVVLAF
jgi:hemolysin activation/secretion protein